MCLTPLVIKTKTKQETAAVPCGRCPVCRTRRASAWSFRLMQEEKVSVMAHFVTITYNTDAVPITPNGFMTLCKTDLQKFFKRLRKIQHARHKNAKSIRYYAAGEYGSRTFRPHYHIILFNCVDANYIDAAWQLNEASLGDIHVGKVENASVGYCLKYITKPSKIPMHARDDREKEFSLMSKGLGASYLTKQMKAWHHNDFENRMHVVTNEGKKVTMPRYYKDRIYSSAGRKALAFFHKQKAEEKAIEKQLTNEELHLQIEAHKQLFQKQKNKDNDKI